MAGFPKDSYYLYKSQWTSEPMVHVMPGRWDWEPGAMINLWIYSNCERVKLELNGKEIASELMADWESEESLHVEVEVAFEPGELVAIGMTGGVEMARDVVRTTGPPRRVNAVLSHDELLDDDHDVLFIEVEVVDGQGYHVPGASNVIYFSVKGPGHIIGVDNGNPVSHECLASDQIHLFNGRALGVLQSNKRSKDPTIEIVVSSPGLEHWKGSVAVKKQRG